MIYKNLSTMIFYALNGNTISKSGEIEMIEERLGKTGVKQDGAVGLIREALKAIEVRKENQLPSEIANRARPRPDLESHVRTLEKDWISCSSLTPYEQVIAAAHDIRKTRVEDSGGDYLADLEELRRCILEEAADMGLDTDELELVSEQDFETEQPLIGKA